MGPVRREHLVKASDLDRFLNNVDYPLFIVTVAAENGDGPESRSGCLVGFATQCSIDPPRFLVCISKINHSYALMSCANVLAVHVIDSDQRALAELFGGESGDEIDKFAVCNWHPGPGGVPLLEASRRRIIADVVEQIDFGDHLGLVLAPFEVCADEHAEALRPSAIADMEPGHPL